MKANIIKIQLYLYVKWWTYTQATCVDNTKTPETFNCIHGRKKWANIDKTEVLLGCLRQVRALHLQSLTFKSLWLENCLALYQERRLTCVYLLTVVDQKNPISRHRREEKAYKNTSFTSLIRSYEVTLPGVKLNLSYKRKKISNSDSSYFVWRKERRRKRKRQKKTTCCMRNKPHCALHASFLFFLSDTQGVVFLFAFFFECYMSQRAQLQQGREVCEAVWQCCHSEAPWGQVLRIDKHGAETHKHESHLKDLKANIFLSGAWIYSGKKHNLVKGWWQ